MAQIGTRAFAPHLYAQVARRRWTAWLALAAMWLFLISPILLQTVLTKDGARFDLSFFFSAATTVLWAAVLHFSTRRPLTLHLLMLPLYLLTAADLFLLLAFGNRLSTGYVIIGLTSMTDTGDFLATYAPLIAGVSIVAVSLYAAGLFAIRRLETRPLRAVSALCLVLLTGLYGALLMRSLHSGSTFEQAALEVAGYESSAPVGDVFQSGLAVYQFNKEAGYRIVREQDRLGATSVRDNAGEVYVMVIGESSRANDWSLLGYNRNTTPYLSATPGVVGLPNMLAAAPSTAIAVPAMLSAQPISDWDGVLARRSVVSAFAEAGFSTHWLSTQRVDGWSGAIPWVASEAKQVRYFEQSFDGALVKPFADILASAKKGEKIFIVLHINGSHFAYDRRYPENFAYFHRQNASYREQMVDQYDNTIRYTDWVVHNVIAALAASHRPAALMFSSDHGENLLDDSRGLLGHGIGNNYDLHPAAFVWMSDAMRQSRPEIWDNLQANADAKVSESNIAHSLLDLAGIQMPTLDSARSIFSASFLTQERSYIANNTLHQEDKLLLASR